MNVSKDTHQRPVDVAAEGAEITGVGLRVVEIGMVTFVGLLVTPPLLILAVVVVVPLIVTSAVLAAVVAMIAVPVWLARRVHAHHQAHGSAAFLHRLSW